MLPSLGGLTAKAWNLFGEEKGLWMILFNCCCCWRCCYWWWRTYGADWGEYNCPLKCSSYVQLHPFQGFFIQVEHRCNLVKNGFVSWCCRVVGELMHRRQAASTLWRRWDHRSHLELHYYSYRWWFSLDFLMFTWKYGEPFPLHSMFQFGCEETAISHGLDDQFVLRDDQLWCVSHDESHQATIMSVLHRSVGWSCCG